MLTKDKVTHCVSHFGGNCLRAAARGDKNVVFLILIMLFIGSHYFKKWFIGDWRAFWCRRPRSVLNGFSENSTLTVICHRASPASQNVVLLGGWPLSFIPFVRWRLMLATCAYDVNMLVSYSLARWQHWPICLFICLISIFSLSWQSVITLSNTGICELAYLPH